jgi:hypothetical protein
MGGADCGYLIPQSEFPNCHFWRFVGLMFGIFFIASLCFLRIVNTPVLVAGA